MHSNLPGEGVPDPCCNGTDPSPVTEGNRGDEVTHQRFPELSDNRGFVILVLFLVAAALLQGALVLGTTVFEDPRPGEAEPAGVGIGDRVSQLRGYGADSVKKRVSMTSGETALLAFSSTCQFCDSIAPEWSRWTRRAAREIRIVLITRDAPSAGLRYIRENDWRGSLLSAETNHMGRPEFYLTSRTPWVFMFDSTGVLRLQGHGSRLPEFVGAMRR